MVITEYLVNNFIVIMFRTINLCLFICIMLVLSALVTREYAIYYYNKQTEGNGPIIPTVNYSP